MGPKTANGHLNFTVRRPGALKIRDYVLNDSTALEEWKLITDDLIYDVSHLHRIAGLLKEHKYGTAIMETLELWMSTSGQAATLKKLIEVFRKHSLNRLAENLEQNSKLIQNDEVTQSPPSSSSTTDNIWFGMTDAVHDFTGRESELEQLHQLIISSHSHSDDAPLLTSVYGLGGVGKTSLVRKYASRYRSHFNDNVVWIEAEKYQTMSASFVKLGKVLGVLQEKHESVEELVQRIYNKIGIAYGRCLFIFDNNASESKPEGVDGIKTFLPVGVGSLPKLHLLITSRGRVVRDIVRNDNDRVLHLDVLSIEDSIKLVQQALALPDSAVAVKNTTKLCEKLDRLPLTLQAIACIFESIPDYHGDTSKAISAYLNEYKTNAKKFLNTHSRDFTDGHRNAKSVFVTLKVILKKIKKVKDGHLALALLKYLAYMNPDNIQIEFLFMLNYEPEDRWTKLKKLLHMDSASQGQEPDELTSRIQKSVNLLSSFSLISAENGVIKVHRMIQDVVKLDVANVNEKVLVKQILLCVGHHFDEPAYKDQSVLHGCALFPYFKKHQLLKSRTHNSELTLVYDKLCQTVDLDDLIASKINCCSRDEVGDLLKQIGRDREAITSAADFINGMNVENALRTYLKISEQFKGSFENTNPKQKADALNIFVFSELTQKDPRANLAKQLMDLMGFLDHRKIDKRFLAALVDVQEPLVSKSLQLLGQYNFVKSIDRVTVRVNYNPESLQAQCQCGDQLASLSVIVSYMLKDLYAMLGEENVNHTAVVFNHLSRKEIPSSSTVISEFISQLNKLRPIIPEFHVGIPNFEETETCKLLFERLHHNIDAVNLASHYISYKKCPPLEYLTILDHKIGTAFAYHEPLDIVAIALRINLDVYEPNWDADTGSDSTILKVASLKRVLYLDINKFSDLFLYPYFDSATNEIYYKNVNAADILVSLGFLEKLTSLNYSMTTLIHQALRIILVVDDKEEVELIRSIAKHIEAVHGLGNCNANLKPEAWSHREKILPYLQKHKVNFSGLINLE